MVEFQVLNVFETIPNQSVSHKFLGIVSSEYKDLIFYDTTQGIANYFFIHLEV